MSIYLFSYENRTRVHKKSAHSKKLELDKSIQNRVTEQIYLQITMLHSQQLTNVTVAAISTLVLN